MSSSRANSRGNEKTEQITSKTLVIEKGFITADHIYLPLKNISLMKVQDNRKKARKYAVATAIVVLITCASISNGLFFSVLEVPATLMAVYVLTYRCHLYIFTSSGIIFVLASGHKKFLQRIKREIERADRSSRVYIDMSIRKIDVGHSNDVTIIGGDGNAVWSTS
jgi:membrane protein implicated in regulation of membrane protease activity